MPKMLYHAFEYCSLKLPIMPHNFPYYAPIVVKIYQQFAPMCLKPVIYEVATHALWLHI